MYWITFFSYGNVSHVCNVAFLLKKLYVNSSAGAISFTTASFEPCQNNFLSWPGRPAADLCCYKAIGYYVMLTPNQPRKTSKSTQSKSLRQQELFTHNCNHGKSNLCSMGLIEVTWEGYQITMDSTIGTTLPRAFV